MNTPKVIVLPGRVDETMLLKGVLARWFRIGQQLGDPKVPVDLLDATRQALGAHQPVRIVVQLSATGVQAVYSNVPGASIEICEVEVGLDPQPLMKGLVSLHLPEQTT